jgi:hypothetical protein
MRRPRCSSSSSSASVASPTDPPAVSTKKQPETLKRASPVAQAHLGKRANGVLISRNEKIRFEVKSASSFGATGLVAPNAWAERIFGSTRPRAAVSVLGSKRQTWADPGYLPLHTLGCLALASIITDERLSAVCLCTH